jgi:hypothetical protein
MLDFDLISLDIESSGSEVAIHSLLSIGCVMASDMSSFYAEVRHENLMVSPEAMRVNGLNITKVDRVELETAQQVDERLYAWAKHSPLYKEGKRYNLIPVGLNVGAFDMPFVRKWLPKSAALFGRRSIDLNALIFMDAVRHQTSFQSTKHAAKTIGHSFALGYAPTLLPHHALHDAYMNLGILEYVMGDLVGSKFSIGEVAWEGGHLVGEQV